MIETKTRALHQKLLGNLPYMPSGALASSWLLHPVVALWLWTHVSHQPMVYQGLTFFTCLVQLLALVLAVRTWQKRGFHWTFLFYLLPALGGMGFLYLSLG